jgi:hypothetical protein
LFLILEKTVRWPHLSVTTFILAKIALASPNGYSKEIFMMGVLLVLLITITFGSTTVQADSLLVGDFENGDLNNWKEKVFKNKTNYQVVNVEGKRAIQAISNDSASGLYREVKIDLEKTPYLNWSWKVENILPNVNEQSKKGDDYPARVYVIFSGGLFFWRTRALDYVWSSHQQVGTNWPNAYTSNTHMIAIQNDKRNIGEWVIEKRNIREDYKRIFGADISSADAVAIMTDTDNTGQMANAYYGNIYFTSE